jgi:hypothetical protein
MMEQLMVKWLTEVLHRRPGALLKKRETQVLGAFQGPLNRESENCGF